MYLSFAGSLLYSSNFSIVIFKKLQSCCRILLDLDISIFMALKSDAFNEIKDPQPLPTKSNYVLHPVMRCSVGLLVPTVREQCCRCLSLRWPMSDFHPDWKCHYQFRSNHLANIDFQIDIWGFWKLLHCYAVFRETLKFMISATFAVPKWVVSASLPKVSLFSKPLEN